MKKLWGISIAVVSISAASLAYCSGGESDSRLGFMPPSLDVAPVTNEIYQNECSACHFAYQPGLLPERSWLKLMSGLDDHFGDNAELSLEDYTVVLDYLRANAADKSDYKRSVRINKSLAADEAPIRITETLYFKRKHDEISVQKIRNNPEIGSFSNCIACHTKADTGSFNEHQIKIPGYGGRWED